MTATGSDIPEIWRERIPLITPAAWRGLKRVLQHPSAPRYNRTIGDRVGEAEMEGLAAFRQLLQARPALEADAAPSSAMTDWLEALRERVLHLQALPRGFDLARDFERIPATSREDITRHLEQLVPHDADLEPAVVYSTSGTTGHPVIIPSHAGAMVKNLAHLELLAALHGAGAEPREGEPFMLNVSAQQRTYVFATAMSGLRGAVFTKLNLSLHDWAGGAAARAHFIDEYAAPWVASEPLTMAEMVRLGLPFRPRMIVSSAVELSAELSERVAAALGTKVVDLYSSTETGPIAASVPELLGKHVVLLPDVFVEALGEDDRRVPDGELGEITVTGGRNPYLPLIRYRTGDHGRLSSVTLPDGRRARAISGLSGRAPVRFEAHDGRPVSSVDVARSIRPISPFVQQRFVQRADRSVELRLRPLPSVPIAVEAMEQVLREIFGKDASIAVVIDEQLGAEGGKVRPWISEL